MSRGLIYSTRGVTSAMHESLIQQMKSVEMNDTVIDLMSSYKSEKPKEHVEVAAGIKINKHIRTITDFYFETAIHMADWEQIYNALDVSFLKEYDNLYLFGGLFSTASNLRRYEKRNFVFPKDAGQIKFQSVALPCIHVLALLKANHIYGIRLHEIVFDPLEMSLDLFHPQYKPTKNYFLYHGYDKPNLNIKRLDSLQFYLNSLQRNFIEEQFDKDLDITFGMTVFEGFREQHYYYAQRFLNKFDKKQMFVYNKITGENTFIDRSEYLKWIARSRYTLILPAYDDTCFSIFRLIESLHNDCLPLLHPECCIVDMNKSFGVDLRELMVDEPFEETKRLELLDKYKKVFLSVERKFLK
jgi:hypothetical protein